MKNMITIIGLGAGDLNQLSLGIYKKLKQEQHALFEQSIILLFRNYKQRV